MVDSADGPDEAIKLCVTKLTRSSLGETGDGNSPQVSKTCSAGNLDGSSLMPDNDGDRAGCDDEWPRSNSTDETDAHDTGRRL
jgi:hypothetical protein